MERWIRADAACGLPATPVTAQACEDRALAGEALARRGWCEARPRDPMERWYWVPCGADVARATVLGR